MSISKKRTQFSAKLALQLKHPEYRSQKGYDCRLQQYITHGKGEDRNADDTDDVAQFFEELSINAADTNPTSDSTPKPPSELFTTYFGTFQNTDFLATTNLLADKVFQHRITSKDKTIAPTEPKPYSFNAATSSRYNNSEFKGLLIDSGAATRSTAGIGQFEALQTIDSSVKLDRNAAQSSSFIFGIRKTLSIGTVNLDTPMRQVVFYIVQADTPFLLCLADMDKLGAYLNNITNKLVQSDKTHLVIRRYGHAFLLWHISAYPATIESFNPNPCFLTDVELRRLHRRFGHPFVRCLQQVLKRAGHNVKLPALQHLTKYCEHCQKHKKSPGRFSFTIKDDIDFNYNIIVDIMYIQGDPVLHIVDKSTRFQAGRWLKDVSAKHVWDQLRFCWINTYLGLPDLLNFYRCRQTVYC